MSRASRCVVGDARERCRRARPSAARSRARRCRGRHRSRSTWMSSGLRAASSASAIAQAASIAPSRPGARIGQRSIGDDVVRARAPQKPTSSTSWRAAPRVKHRAAAAFAVRVDQVVDRRVDVRPAPARRRRGRASRRDSAPRLQCCSAQPPQMPKCGQIGAMRSALGASTLQQMPAVGMAGPRRRPRRSRPAACRARRAARPASRRRRRRDGRAGRSTSRSVTLRSEEEFAVAVAAGDRRGDGAGDAPAERRRRTRRCRRRPRHERRGRARCLS